MLLSGAVLLALDWLDADVADGPLLSVVAGFKQSAGGQISASHPEAQGEAWPHSDDLQQAAATDVLAGTQNRNLQTRNQ